MTRTYRYLAMFRELRAHGHKLHVIDLHGDRRINIEHALRVTYERVFGWSALNAQEVWR